MNATAGIVSLALGVAYIIGVGGLSFLDVIAGWRVGIREVHFLFPDAAGLFARLRLWSEALWAHTEWFGFALAGMAVSCGPHHFHQGLHILIDGQMMTSTEFGGLLFALPFGVAWLAFRTNALFGGSGDLHAKGWPGLLVVGLFSLAVEMTLVVVLSASGSSWSVDLIVQITLAFLYLWIGYFLWIGQVGIHETTGQWSLAGLSLAMVFPTCAVLHASYGLNVAAGRYESDIHFLAIDGLGIPMACWFLVLTYRLRHTGNIELRWALSNALRTQTKSL